MAKNPRTPQLYSHKDDVPSLAVARNHTGYGAEAVAVQDTILRSVELAEFILEQGMFLRSAIESPRAA